MITRRASGIHVVQHVCEHRFDIRPRLMHPQLVDIHVRLRIVSVGIVVKDRLKLVDVAYPRFGGPAVIAVKDGSSTEGMGTTIIKAVLCSYRGHCVALCHGTSVYQ